MGMLDPRRKEVDHHERPTAAPSATHDLPEVNR